MIQKKDATRKEGLGMNEIARTKSDIFFDRARATLVGCMLAIGAVSIIESFTGVKLDRDQYAALFVVFTVSTVAYLS